MVPQAFVCSGRCFNSLILFLGRMSWGASPQRTEVITCVVYCRFADWGEIIEWYLGDPGVRFMKGINFDSGPMLQKEGLSQSSHILSSAFWGERVVASHKYSCQFCIFSRLSICPAWRGSEKLNPYSRINLTRMLKHFSLMFCGQPKRLYLIKAWVLFALFHRWVFCVFQLSVLSLCIIFVLYLD